jgi:thioredoxin reductase (NADPH)
MDCPYCEKAKDLFDSKDIEYDTYNVTGDDELFEEMVERTDGRKTAPEVFIDDELIGGWDDTSALNENGELDEKLGIADEADSDIVEHRTMIIAGTGIAGLTAAIYAGRSNNEPLVIEGDEPGGQLTLTTDVANYPGFPDGIGGPELVNNMKEQATQFGAELKNGIIETIDDSSRPFRVELADGDVYTADAVIAASGASARTLGIPGEDELMGYGLSTCATCDGAFFRGEDMLVVGGGDAAMEEATFLTKFADTVYIAHRREEFRAEDYWIDRVHEKVEDGEIEIMKNTELTEIHGSQEGGVDHVTLVENDKGHPTDRLEDPETEEFEFDVGAVFFAIGHTPNTDYLTETGVEMDADGYLKTKGGEGGGQTATHVEGIFGAGDVVDYHYQQAVTAAGMGSKAALDADEYLEDLERADSSVEEAEPAAADD